MNAVKSLRVWLLAVVLGVSGAIETVAGQPPHGNIASQEPTDAQQIYRRCVAGVVMIICQSEVDDEMSSGSGWVIDKQRRLIITNHHVIANCPQPVVIFPEFVNDRVIAEPDHYADKSKLHRGKVILDDKQRDLAVIQVDVLPAHAIELSISEKPVNPGQRVHSIGNPGAADFGLWILSSGSVRQVATSPAGSNLNPGVRFVLTQVPINPGDSGGPMLDDDGRVIGVSTAGATKASMITFAVDVSEVRKIYGRAIEEQEALNVSRR
ncbi:MAG: S1C family serine protease [Gemmataceae bacterium]